MLTQKAKYGLKAILMLAQRNSSEFTLVAEIADRQRAPRKYLELILLELRKHGFLHSQRGKNGGFRLARPPEQITFGQVIRVLDGPLAPFPCASLTGYRKCVDCSDEQVCAVRKQMRRVRDAMAAILDTTTLADAATPALARDVAADPAPAPIPA
ncbi:MAG: Rrf2 family transcriptional regulator [Alphaproteobacteria bacterium]|nr:Rrf2 family transcriptional regulator [Alphaproteobacteria bacterium]